MANRKVKKFTLYREVLRKMFHLLELPLVMGYALIRYYFGEQVAMLALTATLIILLEIEFFRLEYKLKLPDIIDIIRHHERDNVAGSIFFVSSTIICLATYDYQIAVLALMLTVFGDLMSALVGRTVGRTRIYRRKTLEGFLGGFVTNLVVGFVMLPEYPILFVPMALTASLVELFTGKLDDNLTVPLSAGIVGQVMAFWYGISLIDFPGKFLAWFVALIG